MKTLNPRPNTQSRPEERTGTRTNRAYTRHCLSALQCPQNMEVHQASPRRIKKVQRRLAAGLPMRGRVQRLLKRDMLFWT